MGTLQATNQALSLTPGWEAVRLSLHVLAAAIWVGGQLVMLGMLPTARTLGAEAPKSLARAFAKLSWPAFVVLVATGFWNVAAVHASSKSSAWSAVLGVKYGLVILAGLGAWLHGRATTRAALGVWGSIAGTASVFALVAGILLAS
jgi:putative copper export protein